MSEDRPIERNRARRGLGARGRHGHTTTPAERQGRLKDLGHPGGGSGRARRRTVRDHPEGNR